MSIDRIIHSPARLAIVSQLMVVEQADATWLRGQTGLSWGNLATHARKLEEAGYLSIEKEFVERKPRTMFAMTDLGKQAYAAYRRELLELLGED
ncbi:MAG: transcriptional regulator [Planctomycetota bacterium]|nr:transcriptional regulator [Planctomycetota bacterium]MDP6839884.1 transcriptional regulator [Planctomycetota bacterium]MDP6957019.1 transcriptional regulator [Planctomycetota bacterium]